MGCGIQDRVEVRKEEVGLSRESFDASSRLGKNLLPSSVGQRHLGEPSDVGAKPSGGRQVP